MGYRSDIAYLIKFYSKDQPEKAFADYNHYINWLLQFTDAGRYELNDPAFRVREAGRRELTHMHADPQGLTVYFNADGTKWYENYPEVEFHMKHAVQRVKAYPTGNYSLAILGENYEDITTDVHDPTFFMYEIFNVRREIVIDAPIGETILDAFPIILPPELEENQP